VVAAGLDGLGAAMAAVLAPGPCFLVTNTVVGPLYAQQAMGTLRAAGFEPRLLELPDGEHHKTMDSWAALVASLLDAGIDRRTPVVALGGGVTGDLVGFAAAAVLRGVPLVQVPTTLLAMVDSSVGGKTGFNTPHGKNLVGAFYQPRLVFAATGVLATLAPEEWRCGLGEAAKHGVIRDAALAQWMLRECESLRSRRPEATGWLVRRCCEIKAEVVAADERETGTRAILNFGHTVGHALETALGHGVLRHGEAVALGMLAETRYAHSRGWVKEEGLESRIRQLLAALDLPVVLAGELAKGGPRELSADLLRAARMDKKNARGRLSFVVPTRLGQVHLETLSPAELKDLLAVLVDWEMS